MWRATQLAQWRDDSRNLQQVWHVLAEHLAALQDLRARARPRLTHLDRPDNTKANTSAAKGSEKAIPGDSHGAGCRPTYNPTNRFTQGDCEGQASGGGKNVASRSASRL
jgi:hypothetical protein